jgi:hypothetical protein
MALFRPDLARTFLPGASVVFHNLHEGVVVVAALAAHALQTLAAVHGAFDVGEDSLLERREESLFFEAFEQCGSFVQHLLGTFADQSAFLELHFVASYIAISKSARVYNS